MLGQVTQWWLRLPTTKETAKERSRRSRMTRKTKLLLVVEGPSTSIREREREECWSLSSLWAGIGLVISDAEIFHVVAAIYNFFFHLRFVFRHLMYENVNEMIYRIRIRHCLYRAKSRTCNAELDSFEVYACWICYSGMKQGTFCGFNLFLLSTLRC